MIPSQQTFTDLFKKYLIDAREARDKDRPERQLSHLLLGFLSQAFNVETSQFILEQRTYLGSVKRLGYMDALFGDLVIEFKRQIEKDKPRYTEQLQNYLRSLSGNHIGLLTDGLAFEIYTLEGETLRQTDSFNLETTDAETAFIRLDAYLFSQNNVRPTSADIVQRFGGTSPTFQAAFGELRSLLEQVDAVPKLAVWRDQWRRLLSKVYGSDIGSDDLFLRHTYLCQFARLLAYAALRGIPDSDATVKSIITGDAFAGQGVSNIAETDFFSWVLMPAIQDKAVRLFRRLAEGLIVYDLERIDQDLLKQLYQNLVDPETRHELGEYYTPDWLAELTLEDINYQPGQSLLDPACGSGSFLFSAIKRLAAQGLTGWTLVEFAVDNVVGMDVHPLAVTVARINYLLALAEHLRAPRPAGKSMLLTLPVYMADALITPLENRSEDALIVPVDDQHNERFQIPIESASIPSALTEVIDQMNQFARRKPLNEASFSAIVNSRFQGHLSDAARIQWMGNLRLLAKLIDEDRNGIWSYILKNLSRPLVLAQRRFDVITGNPPWLSYRFIKSRAYQKTVKDLYQYYKLIESSNAKLFTQMDLSTLFFAHARDQYLKPGGTLAFVMPRTVITGAKQHRPFQAQGITRVIDLRGVEPLFNTETCVYIHEGKNVLHDEVPSVHYTGKLNAHELSLEDARPSLTRRETTVRFVDSDVRSPYYYERFSQGATLVPRNLCFVKPEGLPSSPAVVSDPDADREAKKPWKGISLRGVVDDDYIYATLLSKHLIPFGYEKLHMVALPARLEGDGKMVMLEQENDFAERGHFTSFEWFSAAEAKWDSLKKQTGKMSLLDRNNYQRLLSNQTPRKGLKVLYNHSGTHISSCVIDFQEETPLIYGRHTQGFVVDVKTYYCNVFEIDEAHYLCALLNTPSVDKAIKAYQTRGIYKGERDIHRTPFEACAIPPFDSTNADHLELARLSREAHELMSLLKAAGGIRGSVYAIRDKARAEVKAQIAAIDVIAHRVLGLP